MTKRNIILIHRGPEYERDFDEIATRVNAIDRGITVYHLPYKLKAELPESAWQYPTLTVSLSSAFRLPVKRGPILRNAPIGKLEQQEIFRRNGIATPPALAFRFGMKLDPILFGEFVILKPGDLTVTSTGEGIQLFRRQRCESLTAKDFPPGHLIHRNPNAYLVQRFIDTGDRISVTRVTTFFGKPILSIGMRSNVSRPPLAASDAELEATPVASNAVKDKMRYLHADADMEALAQRVHDCLPEVPLLGVDIVREQATGELHVLECNAGGNTWHFSSKSGEKLRGWFGGHPRVPLERASAKARLLYISQHGGFDRVAETLARLAHERAA
jgi:hypothetical protein